MFSPTIRISRSVDAYLTVRNAVVGVFLVGRFNVKEAAVDPSARRDGERIDYSPRRFWGEW